MLVAGAAVLDDGPMTLPATTGPVTLVTGGSTGIGAATVRLLLKHGHRVVATGRDPKRLADLADSVGHGDQLLTLPGDTTEYDAVESAVRTAAQGFGRLDNVVANAGFSTHDTLETGDPEQWRAMLLTNVLGPAMLVKAALPALRESMGRIVMVGSVAGLRNSAGNMYSVTKWALTALAENTRLLVTRDGVGVTMIAPGRVDTPFWEERTGGRPSGPVLDADRVADNILWALAQPQGTDVNQIVIRPVGQRA
jgi:NADP-dependent 3-hydroxy acid dehydrogenase YdfG